MNRGAAAFAASALLALAGCVVAWKDSFTYSFGDRQACALSHEWCIVEVPKVGYLGVKAQGDAGTEVTSVTVRLAPLEGVRAGWGATEVTVVDLDGKATRPFAKLDTRWVIGGSNRGAPGNEVFNGPYAQADFVLRPRIRDFELRFPAVILPVGEARSPVVQVHDGVRYPVPLPAALFSGH